MTTTVVTAEDRQPSIGKFRVVTRTYDNDDLIIGVHRGPEIFPGYFVSANNWQSTDVSGYPAAIRATAAEMWTPAAIEACKAAKPWVEPTAPKTPGELDQETLNDALLAQGSIFRGLALVLFDEINKIRVDSGKTAYTMTQYRNAVLSKMRP